MVGSNDLAGIDTFKFSRLKFLTSKLMSKIDT